MFYYVNIACYQCLDQCLLQHRECAFPFFVDDKVFVFAKKGGDGLGDFCKVLDESPIEADVPEKAPQIFHGTW